MQTKNHIRELTVTAMLSAVGFVLMMIDFSLPMFIPSFVKMDISELPALLASFSLGPVYGVLVCLVKNVLAARTAVLGALIGAVAMAAASVPVNYFISYPVYAAMFGGMDAILAAYEALNPNVDGLLGCLLLFNMPFTLVKGLIDAVLCFLIYKPLSPILHGER